MQGIKNDTLIGLTNKGVRKRGRDQPQVHKKLSKLKKKTQGITDWKNNKNNVYKKENEIRVYHLEWQEQYLYSYNNTNNK